MWTNYQYLVKSNKIIIFYTIRKIIVAFSRVLTLEILSFYLFVKKKLKISLGAHMRPRGAHLRTRRNPTKPESYKDSGACEEYTICRNKKV